MLKTFQFLKGLELAWEPPAGHHHTIRHGELGSDRLGWSEVLVVTIVRHNGSQNYIITAEEVDRPVNELIAEIVAQERAYRG